MTGTSTSAPSGLHTSISVLDAGTGRCTLHGVGGHGRRRWTTWFLSRLQGQTVLRRHLVGSRRSTGRRSGLHVNGMVNLSSPSRFVQLVLFSGFSQAYLVSTALLKHGRLGLSRSGGQPQTGVESEHGNRSVGCSREVHPGASCDSICKTMRLLQLAIEGGQSSFLAATMEPVATSSSLL